MGMMERFGESEFHPVRHDGEIVHPFAALSVARDQEFDIEWVSTGSPRVQGLGVRVVRLDRRGDAGQLEIAGRNAPAMMLWHDSAPPRVTVRCLEIEDHAVVRISNRWRHDDGREDEWLNNYGIRVEEEGADSVVLHCSDGVGDEPTFTDLVVRVTRPPGSPGDFLVPRSSDPHPQADT